MVVSRSRTYAPCYCDLTLAGEELEQLKSVRILGVTSGSKLTFQTHLREVVSKAARKLGVVRRARQLFDCPRDVISCFNTYVLSSLEYCAPVQMSSAESHLSLLDSTVRSEVELCEGDICCMQHRRQISTFCLVYEIYYGADHILHEYLHHFVAASNTRGSNALCELAVVIPRCRTVQYSRSILPVAVGMWNLLPPDVLSGDTLSFFKSAMNLCLYREICLIFSHSLFRSFSSVLYLA